MLKYILNLLLTCCTAGAQDTGDSAIRVPADWTWTGATEIALPDAPAGYQTMRWCAACSATAAVPPGVYVVVLHFIEPAATAKGQRVFDVCINDQPALLNLDIFARVGAMTPLERSVVVVAQDGQLVIDLKGKVGTARIVSMDVYQMPNSQIWPWIIKGK